MTKRTSPIVLFQYKTFRSLWSASLVSNLGSLVEGVGAAWLMTSLATSHEEVALVQTSATLPVMVFSLVAGALADSFDRRRIMLAAQLLMLCVSTALAFLAYAGIMTPWLLLGFTFLIGCGWALHDPPWYASMGDIVPREHLASAAALNSMSYNLMRSIGPAVGGIIVAAAGAAFAFLFNVFCYFALIVALWRWKTEPAQGLLPREPFSTALAAGFRYVLLSPKLLKVMCRSLMFGLTAVVIPALLPFVARDQVEGTSITYGIMLGFFGLGAICGALLIGRVREVLSSEWVIRGAFLVLAISCYFLAGSEHVWLSCLLLIPAGMAWVQAFSLFNVTVQLSTPRWVVGRALSLYQAATFGGMAAGSWIWGKLADAQGVSGALLLASLALIFGGLIGIVLREPDFEMLNLDPTSKFIEPTLQLDLQPRSGPISVTVDYSIDQEDVAEFLRMMALRRRALLRDGARQWALFRDLEEAHMWTESYHVPTWIEYVRHSQRQTRADAELVARLGALHRDDCPPKTRHKIERQPFRVHNELPLKRHFDRI
ncbi:MFS transporter (plasmid) [Sinorhizobium numidicum]|uniref:MFS transporter n=1 Tax=Sinorhizobium numidicum TaxID=680248 RepID=A0ABY8D386_9HYPH|nr:MFS transporter [Sinorhizobium numidicum]WEX79290.1 MFS transporter [Sinorhizobium numidicum]WEX85339.1 MFS transporter [Sinorhizobium numidicum]